MGLLGIVCGIAGSSPRDGLHDIFGVPLPNVGDAADGAQTLDGVGGTLADLEQNLIRDDPPSWYVTFGSKALPPGADLASAGELLARK